MTQTDPETRYFRRCTQECRLSDKYNTTFLPRNAAIENSPSVALAVKSGTSWSITMGIKFSPVGQYSGNPRAFFSEIASGARSDTVPAAEKCSTQSRLARPRHDRDKPRRFYEARRSYPFEDAIPDQCAYYRFSARAPACLDSRRRNRRQTKYQPVRLAGREARIPEIRTPARAWFGRVHALNIRFPDCQYCKFCRLRCHSGSR